MQTSKNFHIIDKSFIILFFLLLPVAGVLGPESLAVDGGDSSRPLWLGLDFENRAFFMPFRKDMVLYQENLFLCC